MSYRLALLVDSLRVPKSVRQIAEWARDHPSIDLVAIVLDGRPDSHPGHRTSTPAAGVLLKLLNAIEKLMVLQGEEREHFALRPIGQFAEVVPLEQVRVGSMKLDAIVDCTSKALNDDIARLAKDGVIALRCGSLGGPPGFVEVLDGRPQTSFAVERRRGSGSETLLRGSIGTSLFHAENYAAVYDRATPYLLASIERLASGEADARQAENGSASATGPIGAGDVLAYMYRTLGRVMAKAWRHAAGREWNWGVAYTFAPWQDADLRSGKILPKLAGTFIADPFVVDHAGKRYIFLEEFPFSTRKGVISVFEVDESGAERVGIALEEPYHLSFPFVFRNGGRFFMVPEGQGGGELVLYECEDFPLKWARRRVLLPDICADTVLFEHDSRWWMLTTIKGAGRAENNAELHAFYADDPLGEWHPHLMNPVVLDAAKARNGGLLKDDEGTIFRVAQRARFRTYGDGFAIYRIDELTPNSYRETMVREVGPDFFPNLAGTHHMHSQAGLTVYDFSRDERP